MNFELYHDESQEAGYWHGMLLVPTQVKSRLLELLENARKQIGYKECISLKKVKEKKSKIFTLASAWINIGVASLIQDFKNKKYLSFFGKYEKGKLIPELFTDVLKCKFILFCEKDNHMKMQLHKDYGSKVETIFKMGMKGGLHYLGNQDNPINIVKIHFDGHEHYRRNIDKDRIVKRLTDLKEFCTIEDRLDLIDDRTSNHNKENSQEYDDCQILQLTDLIVGGFRTYLGQCTREIHKPLNHPIKLLIDAYIMGFARMKNSRWFNGFCLSQCYLDNNQWVFEEIAYASKDGSEQLILNLN